MSRPALARPYLLPALGALLVAVGGGDYLWIVAAVVLIGALLAVHAAAATVGRARPGSLVDRAERGRVWVVAATVIPVMSALRMPSPAFAVMAGAATLAIAAIGARDLVALLRLPKPTGLRPRNRALLASVGNTHVIDLGIGSVEWQQVLPPSDPYRSAERVLRTLRGDFLESRRALARVVAFDACLFLFALSWFTLWQPVR